MAVIAVPVMPAVLSVVFAGAASILVRRLQDKGRRIAVGGRVFPPKCATLPSPRLRDQATKRYIKTRPLTVRQTIHRKMSACLARLGRLSLLCKRGVQKREPAGSGPCQGWTPERPRPWRLSGAWFTTARPRCPLRQRGDARPGTYPHIPGKNPGFLRGIPRRSPTRL